MDPEVTIPSTTVIPGQQAYLTRKAIHTALDHVLPKELLDLIGTHIGDQLTEDEARRFREELMDERTAFVSETDDSCFTANCSFCQH